MRTHVANWLALSLVASFADAQTTPTVPAPTPRTEFDSPVLEFDFPGMEIGVAEYDEGPTGATVFYFPRGVMAAVDVRGGAPGTINTDGLRLGYESQSLEAVAFAGGSAYGLAAATGVADAIKARTAAAGDWGNIATVAGAIVFDLGGRRFNTVTPDYDLGRAAMRAVRPSRFPLGARGAGRFTMQGGFFGDSARQHSGQGAAFRQIGATRIAVFTVVNSLGSVVDRAGSVVRCGRATAAGCGAARDHIARATAEIERRKGADTLSASSGNTTLTLVVINQRVPYWMLQRLAVQVHTSMARAIQPFATQRDGDVLFAVSTGDTVTANLSADELGLIASELAWDAVLSSVPRLPAPPPTRPRVQLSPAQLDDYVGEFALSPRASISVSREGERLWIASAQGAGIYVPTGARYELEPVGDDEFVMMNARGDRIRFGRDPGGRVTAIALNPDAWPVRGSRTP